MTAKEAKEISLCCAVAECRRRRTFITETGTMIIAIQCDTVTQALTSLKHGDDIAIYSKHGTLAAWRELGYPGYFVQYVCGPLEVRKAGLVLQEVGIFLSKYYRP